MTESDNSDPLVEQYRPTTFSDVQGNNSAIDDIKSWAEGWSEGDPPLLLVGEPGTGKTTIAHVLTSTYDWPLHQVNASSARKTDDIENVAGSLNTTTADGEHKLVLLDEVDSMHSSVSMTPLKKALKDAQNPVVMTANDDYQVPSALKRPAEQFDIKLSKASRRAKIKEIVAAEDFDLDDQDIETLAERGNLRAAIHDLQIVSETGVPPHSDQRSVERSDFDAIQDVLRGDTSHLRDDMWPDDAQMWLDHNLIKEWSGIEAGLAYDALGRADVWLGEKDRTQNYRWQRYAAALQEQVTGLLLHEPYQGYRRDTFPQWFRSSMTRVDEDSPEAALYRALHRYDDGGVGISGSYLQFRQVELELLRGLPDERKFRLCLEHRLEGKAIDALGVTESEYQQWREVEAPTQGEGVGTGNALDW